MAICKQKADQKPTAVLGQDKVNYIYSHTLPQSPMRRLAVDIWARSATTKTFEKKKGGLPRPFLEELCAELITQKETTGLTTNQPLFPDPEDRYRSRYWPVTDREGEVLPPREPVELRHTASRAQLESRKFKIPCLPTKKSSRLLASASGSTREVHEPQDMCEDLTKLNIQNQ